MINYLWLGLVLIAIAIGAGKEIAGYQTKETPEPVAVVGVEPGAFPGSTETVIDEKAVYSYDVDFTGEDKVSVPLSVEIEDLNQEVELIHKIGGDSNVDKDAISVSFPAQSTEDLKLEFQVIDADNEVFFANAGDLTSGTEELAEVSFNFSDLIASPDNVTASVDYPITVSSVTLKGNDISSAEFMIGAPSFGFEEVSYADGESESWMLVLTEALADYAEFSITLAIGLIGIMMFWLGLMKIAEAAGLVKVLARALKPVMVFLFPEIDPDGDAMGAILMNVAANMLGLGNAATPLGIKAMKELQKENPYRDHASNAQCMLLAINTSSVTLLPATVIGYRAAAGSANLMEFWPVMIASTVCATIAAVLATKILEKMPMFAIPADAARNTGEVVEGEKS